ncbi:hypothetical protein LCGC14_2229660 [marine sediment metagenome]|uniref:DUF1360 domain-containing protein n=1 Tax=marine sediment metagenome TaxID=412755 RepID=A0A0F9D8U2_9ZZZZ
MLLPAIAVSVLKFLSAVLLTESLTELVIKSEIIKPARDFIKSRGSWLKTLFSCGYCFSVWTAFGVAFLLGLAYNLTGWYWVDLTLTSLLIHRLSNYLHNFNDKYLDKYYDTRYINSGSMPEEEE